MFILLNCYFLLDDDLAIRIKERLRITRGPTKFSRFKMIRHEAQIYNPNALKHLSNAKKRSNKDGVNSVKYKVVKKDLYPGFTYILIDIGEIDEK